MTEAALASEIFRAYDIRGIVGKGLNPDIMQLLGRAIASEALDLGETSLVVGADARLSSPDFREAMIAGILSTGCNVISIGTVPSPVLYFATHTLSSSSGVMVTGSHNPGNYNGVKMVFRAHCPTAQQIQDLKTRIDERAFHAGSGKLEHVDLQNAYIERITGDIALNRPMKVVIDAGNGVTGLIAPALFRALGCEVTPLYCELDGHFPNHHPDPTVAANLQDLVKEVLRSGADLGIAFDGDGDRLGLVTARGEIIDADKMLLCFISDILPDNPGARVVFDVKSSYRIPELVTANGGSPVMCKSGHSFVKHKMRETDAILGGEFSAHIFFRHRWYGFDDGLYTAARFLELMSRYNSSADEFLSKMPPGFSTPELCVEVEEADKFDIVAAISKTISLPGATLNRLDGVRADYPDGWGLIRASNTTPRLICRFEAGDETRLLEIQASVRAELLRIVPALQLPF